MPKNEAACRAERANIESFEVKRQKEMDKASRKASKTSGKSSVGVGKDVPASATRCWHDAAFLVPVPMFFGNGALNAGGCVPQAGGQVVSIYGSLPGVSGSTHSA